MCEPCSDDRHRVVILQLAHVEIMAGNFLSFCGLFLCLAAGENVGRYICVCLGHNIGSEHQTPSNILFVYNILVYIKMFELQIEYAKM